MKRKELRREIWQVIEPLTIAYMRNNHVSYQQAVQAVREETRNLFHLPEVRVSPLARLLETVNIKRFNIFDKVSRSGVGSRV